MKIGVPKEIKPQESRIGLTPDSVKTLVSEGHDVLVENNGGFEAGFENDQYLKAGAKIVDTAADIFNRAKNLAPYFQEGLMSLKDIDVVDNIRGYGMMGGIDMVMDKKPGAAGFTCFKHCYEAGVNFKATGDCLIIAPMSAVAGRMSVQAGAHCLEKNQKGRGLLLGGAPGVLSLIHI